MRRVVVATCLTALLSAGCSSENRHTVVPEYLSNPPKVQSDPPEVQFDRSKPAPDCVHPVFPYRKPQCDTKLPSGKCSHAYIGLV
ncbi:MAG: hypothetical protein ABIA93_00285 [Candidatus Woesearchaeota archaeon]